VNILTRDIKESLTPHTKDGIESGLFSSTYERTVTLFGLFKVVHTYDRAVNTPGKGAEKIGF
jgi:hypothetical protein